MRISIVYKRNANGFSFLSFQFSFFPSHFSRHQKSFDNFSQIFSRLNWMIHTILYSISKLMNSKLMNQLKEFISRTNRHRNSCNMGIKISTPRSSHPPLPSFLSPSSSSPLIFSLFSVFLLFASICERSQSPLPYFRENGNYLASCLW